MFLPHHKFDTCQQALVILGQSVKHSAHVEIKAANMLRRLPLQAQFVKKADSKPGATTRYMAFIRVPTDFYTQFPFLKARAEVPESSAKHNGLVTGRASIDVCFEPFKAHGPEQEDSRGPVQEYPAILGLQVGQSPTADHVRSAMLRAYVMGQDPAKILSCVVGFLSESEVNRLQEAFGAVDKQALQSFNIFSACRHPELRDTILRSMSHDQSSVSLPSLPPSYMGMITFVGSRAQKHATATTLLVLASLGPVFATASSNFIANEFAAALQADSEKVMERLNTPQGSLRFKIRSPLVIRGFAVELELLEFMELVKARWRRKTGISPHVAAGAWQKSLSLCEWLFKVTKILNNDLLNTDHAALFTLREAIRKTDFYRPLRTSSYIIKSPANVGLDDDVSKVLKEACAFLVNHCSILCTTPTMSQKPLYRDFKTSAKAIAISDADNITRPEAVLAIGDKMRPCVMGGFTPNRSPRPNKAFDSPQNPLWADLHLSLLAAHVENGFFYISC
ncbi:uncharacterized protein J7T54_004965 [Emericellopsis cladophorae]|uniref:Uncharacterized protein n=1 Tax=Emericellopsis cladophorae TaxID=2686198 RepID=A0A9P9Y2L2_9HYPO|nr:uncharacterized protein J7T54_004965 [Emericellopsis cladophorae]KAI6781799.1 hypothetical protein J7T54_004965 [Emericellopsis cladophorae]